MVIKKILIIQTAFIGDVVLATVLIEQLREAYPTSRIDFLLRKGNEGLLEGHPYLHRVWIWNKVGGKIRNLFRLVLSVRTERYDLVVNVQRFASSGILASLSNAKHVVGFKKNPFSRFFDHTAEHAIKSHVHETDRNLKLVSHLVKRSKVVKPVLYPTEQDRVKIKSLQAATYICIAPTSVWFTKQLPKEKWISLIERLSVEQIYLLGAPNDAQLCEEIARNVSKKNVEVLAGRLTLLQSAALMEGALLNYVNDSAPMHLASAVNAPVCAVYCSTVPDFGFGPLSDFSRVVEIQEKLPCRPCGLHGYASCPEKHFRCATDIKVKQMKKVFDEAARLSNDM